MNGERSADSSRAQASGERAAGELGQAARGGALTFVGAAVSAGFGFAFSLLLARLLGASDAGVILQAVAVATIGASLGRLGADTTAVWLLPRLLETDRALVPSAVAHLMAVSATGVGAVLLLWFAVIRRWWPTTGDSSAVLETADVLVLCIPAAVLAAVALACARAFGRIVAFNLIDNVFVPVARPVALLAVHAGGGGLTWAALAWGGPLWVGAAGAVVVLAASLVPLRGSRPEVPAVQAMRREVRSYTLPRAFAQAMEQSLIWVDVLLVGAIAGAAAAGVYGSAARFVAAGVIVATALRIVVAPRFSALLAQGRTDEVGDLYRVTARWILLFGSPIYLTLAVFAPTVLGWLGPEFAAGRTALIVLCLGSVVVLAAGNVQALLLMSGGSKAGAVNKAVVLAVNCVGNLALVPLWGITAAAAVWAASMVLDTVLASVQVRRATGITLAWGAVVRIGGGTFLAVGGPLVAVALLGGQGEVQLVIGIVAGALGLAVLGVAERQLLRWQLLRTTLRR